MTLPYQTKTFSFSIKAVDDEQGLIEAYGSVFNNVDQGNDRVKPGAFKRTIQNSKSRMQAGKKFLWPMLYQHDVERPIGGWYDAEETNHGLFVKGKLNLDTQLGRETYSNIKMGIIEQFSIGYEVANNGSSYDKSGVRDLKEVRLWEISPVTFAMNEEALLVGVKNASDKTKDKDAKEMDKKPTQTKPPKPQKKDFNDELRTRKISAWQHEFYSLLYALNSSAMDAFDQGDDPMGDIMADLNGVDDSPGFIAALQAWVQEGIDLDFSNYLDEMEQSDPSSYYGCMSGKPSIARKAGAMFSQANLDMLGQHMASLHDAGDQLHQMADDLATNTGATTYDDSAGDDAEHGDNEKRNSRTRALAAKGHSSPQRDTDDGEKADITGALARLTALTPKF